MKNKKAEQILILTIAVIAALIVGFVIGRRSALRTDTAMPAPTNTAAAEPTDAPTDTPTSTPTVEATDVPTNEPTGTPTAESTDEPAGTPTDEPTDTPTGTMTAETTDKPADTSTAEPTGEVSEKPTEVPAADVTSAPANPMVSPSAEPLPLAGVKIGIDPGHQAKANSDKEPVAPGSSEMKAKVSSGTQGVSTRVAEYIVNLDVALQLRDALEAQGAQVYMTRETHDVDISNVERATMMNELGVDMVLRIHCNGSTDSSVKGIGLYVKKTGDAAEESYEICEYLLPAMAEATGARAMGIYQRDTYSGMNWSTVPSILVEMGFMSNPEEDELLNDPDYQQLLVEGMVQGIEDYVNRNAAPEDGAAE